MNKGMKTILDGIFATVLDCSQSAKENIYKSVYRDILDNFALFLVIETFESKEILSAMSKLSKMERVIIAFHFVLNLDLNEISVIVHSSLESVYSQKSKAIRKMRLWLSVK